MKDVEILILGTAQDGSIPHPNCSCQTCMDASKKRLATSLALIDHNEKKWFLIEATPDFPKQLRLVMNHLKSQQLMSGILITHGHIGHYTGLMYLGKECMNTQNIPLYIEQSLSQALKTSIPFSFLYQNKNVSEVIIEDQIETKLTSHLSVIPIEVPHRNEVGKTFGFIIKGPNKKLLFIPDLDSYEAMYPSMETYLDRVDHCLIDATFFTKEEIQATRDYHLIPHPTIETTIQRLGHKSHPIIELIHFNHTNLIFKDKECMDQVLQANIRVSNDLDIIKL